MEMGRLMPAAELQYIATVIPRRELMRGIRQPSSAATFAAIRS